MEKSSHGATPIGDFRLKCCMEGKKFKNKISGETVEKPFSIVNGWFSGVS
jgi:hypothetical protein